MIRKAFFMKVKPGCIEKYTQLHNPIPDDFKTVLQKHGVHNYSIFHHPESNTIVGYMEIEDIEEIKKISSYPCAHAWWKCMTQYLECRNPGDEKAIEDEMQQVFFME